MNGHDQQQIIKGCRTQVGHEFQGLNGPTLLEKYLAAEETRRLSALRIVVPEMFDLLLLSHNHVCASAALGELRENFEGGEAAYLDEHRVSD